METVKPPTILEINALVDGEFSRKIHSQVCMGNDEIEERTERRVQVDLG